MSRTPKKTLHSFKDSPDEDIAEPEDTGEPKIIVNDSANEEKVIFRIILPEIWLLISHHIRPEDVGTFAAVCRTTYDITRRAQFWRKLYKRYGPIEQPFGGLTGGISLPMRLQPESMVRLGGLRACVIRTLFYTHRPFVRRLENLNRNLDLTSFKCSLRILQMWSVQLKEKLWAYSFRLQAPVANNLLVPNVCDDPHRNVLDNPDNCCRILHVESPKFVPLPQTFDQKIYLKTVTYNMSQGLRSYKINMDLVLYNGSQFARIVLDPATNIKVWDWWQPEYHLLANTVGYVPEDEEDSFFNL